VLPDVEFTTDDLSILPDGCRYELIEGRLDLWDRAPLSDLVGLGLLATLRASCPPGMRVAARPALWLETEAMPAPEVAVMGPGGDRDIRLVVDVRRPNSLFADWLKRFHAFAVRDIPCSWLFESSPSLAPELTVFRHVPDCGFEAVQFTGGVLAVDDPFPVTVDLPGLCRRWPQTLEYAECRGSVPSPG
jgi:hypothetical protein